MVDMHHGSMAIMNDKTLLYTTLLDHLSLTVTNVKINGALQMKHPLKYIDEK